jgi:hypothetical protein
MLSDIHACQLRSSPGCDATPVLQASRPASQRRYGTNGLDIRMGRSGFGRLAAQSQERAPAGTVDQSYPDWATQVIWFVVPRVYSPEAWRRGKPRRFGSAAGPGLRVRAARDDEAYILAPREPGESCSQSVR